MTKLRRIRNYSVKKTTGIRHILYNVMRAYSSWNIKKRIIIFGGAVILIIGIVLACTLPAKNDNIAMQASTIDIPTEINNDNTQTESLEPTSQPTPTPTIAPTPTPDPTLKRGDENERVQQLQERLTELGYLDIDESTQLFGPATEYAVGLFQRQHELQRDGIAGPETLGLIYSDEAKKYTLLEGTEGRDVDSLQRQLVRMGYMGKTTGYYGTETVAAVKEFQERNSLEVDGKTGQYTLDLIYSPNAKESANKAQGEKRRANILEMLEAAQKQLGKPYILGNEGPNSFDCSGLVYYCLKVAGSSRGRYNAAGYSQVTEWDKINSFGDLEKGDLLYFWSSSSKTRIGHVGIYVGSGLMIDASSRNGKVVKRDCHWDSFAFARRPW